MVAWIAMPEDDRKQILTEVAAEKNLPETTIEKDVWVTLVLEALFSIPEIKDHLVFKGGTSLSKGYKLIDRFSEDIDFAIDRRFLGFSGALTKTKIEEKLRPASAAFIKNTLIPKLHTQMEAMGVSPDIFKLAPKPDVNEKDDPLPLYVHYHALFGTPEYLNDKVEVEVSARSLMEPSEPRTIQSLIADKYAGSPFAGNPFVVQAVLPQRTFLEKVFLLHELFQRPVEKAIAKNRMSRHLYDLEKLMDSDFAIAAIGDQHLYKDIVAHRQLFTPTGGISYDKHSPEHISFIPPEALLDAWRADYEVLSKNMIGGSPKPFDQLIERMQELTQRFRKLSDTQKSAAANE